MNPFEPMPLDDADEDYVRAHFDSLSDACASRGRGEAEVRAQIAAGALPAPTYVLRDGTPMVPRGYFDLEPRVFAERFRAAAERHGECALDAEIADAYEGWRLGHYGACLREVTPENIWRKETLVGRVRDALANPAPSDPRWRARVFSDVEELDALEQPFARWDRVRFGRPVTRDTLIDGARARFPSVFDRTPGS
jgi:hypothetical protein